MGAVTARRFRDEGAAVVLTGRTREKLTKVVSQFDQGRSLIHVSDVTNRSFEPEHHQNGGDNASERRFSRQATIRLRGVESFGPLDLCAAQPSG